MELLITGGLGFIGSNFIRYMLTKYSDIRVTNIDKFSIGANPANLSNVEKDSRYELVKGDIANKTIVEKFMEEKDAVVNFAAETHVDRSISEPWPFINSNILGAVNLFEVAKKQRKRILHISTDEIYGDTIKGSFREGDKVNPSSPYSASKASADLFAQAYRRTHNLDVLLVRCTNNYGPYQFPEKLIPKTIIRALAGLLVPVYGRGQNIRDWIYVQDFCEALDLILNKGKSGEIYNVSAGNERTNIEVVKTILNFIGKSEDTITFVEDRPGHDIRYSLDSSKIRLEFGWKPKRGFKKALKETVNWYIHNEWWWKPIATEEVLHPTPWKLKW